MSLTRVRSRAVRLPGLPRDFFSSAQNSDCSLLGQVVPHPVATLLGEPERDRPDRFPGHFLPDPGHGAAGDPSGHDLKVPGRGPPLGFARAGRRPPPPVIAALAAAVTGPRGRWVTIAVWVALGIGGYVARSHIGEVTAAGQSSFLPKGAESIHAIEVLDGATTLAAREPDDAASGAGRRRRDRGGGRRPDRRRRPDDRRGLQRRRGPGGDRLRPRRRTDARRPERDRGARPRARPARRHRRDADRRPLLRRGPGRPLGEVADYAHGVGPISKDGEAALLVLALNAADHGAISNGVDRDARIPRRPPGPRACTPTSPARPGSPPTSTRSPTKRAARC